ncbi:hypothetical protein Tco_0023448 [Tanacetum coccineum]
MRGGGGGGEFWCDSCDSIVDYPVLRYRRCCEGGGGSNSDMVAAKADSKAPEVKSLNKSPLLSTPSKPTKEKKHRREKLEDSDAEESFVVDSHPEGDDVGCSSDTKKERRVVLEDSE